MTCAGCWTSRRRPRPTRRARRTASSGAHGRDEPQAVAHFVKPAVVFCMFAADIGLLPGDMFTRMLRHALRAPEQFPELAGELFQVMASGGRVGFETVAWFNGGLFDDGAALPLERSDIETVLAAGRAARPCPSSAATRRRRNATCRLSATPSRKRSNASDGRAFRCSTAAAGSTGNPVRAQNASRTCSHCAAGRKNASNRPKFFAPSMARLPVWRMSGCSAARATLPRPARRRTSSCAALTILRTPGDSSLIAVFNSSARPCIASRVSPGFAPRSSLSAVRRSFYAGFSRCRRSWRPGLR